MLKITKSFCIRKSEHRNYLFFAIHFFLFHLLKTNLDLTALPFLFLPLLNDFSDGAVIKFVKLLINFFCSQNCENAKCSKFTCNILSIEKGQNMNILLVTRIWEANFVKVIIFKSILKVYILNSHWKLL